MKINYQTHLGRIIDTIYQLVSPLEAGNARLSVLRELKEEKGKSFAQVTEILQGKYPKDKWKLSRVKKVYYDARQRETLQKLKQQRDLQTP